MTTETKSNLTAEQRRAISERLARGRAASGRSWHDRIFPEKICIDCMALFQPTGCRHVRCVSCQTAHRKWTIQKFNKKYYATRLKGRKPRPCRTCGASVLPRHNYCSLSCRPSTIQMQKANGQTGSHFRINGLTLAEYAFYRLMKDRGIHLQRVPQHASNGLFQLHRGCYTPDFYDPNLEIYYEVIGSRQRLHSGQAKYQEVVQRHPSIRLLFVYPDGTEIDLTTDRG